MTICCVCRLQSCSLLYGSWVGDTRIKFTDEYPLGAYYLAETCLSRLARIHLAKSLCILGLVVAPQHCVDRDSLHLTSLHLLGSVTVCQRLSLCHHSAITVTVYHWYRLSLSQSVTPNHYHSLALFQTCHHASLPLSVITLCHISQSVTSRRVGHLGWFGHFKGIRFALRRQ